MACQLRALEIHERFRRFRALTEGEARELYEQHLRIMAEDGDLPAAERVRRDRVG